MPPVAKNKNTKEQENPKTKQNKRKPLTRAAYLRLRLEHFFMDPSLLGRVRGNCISFFAILGNLLGLGHVGIVVHTPFSQSALRAQPRA